MSLVEATVILGVIAMLTSIMAPAVRGYVLDAQNVAARHDVDAIGAALGRMLTDVGEAWVLRNGAKASGATSHVQPSHASGNRVDMLATAGKTPALLASIARSPNTLSDWNDSVDDGAIQTLDNYLVLNKPSTLTANAYRTASTMDGTGNFDPDDGSGFNADYVWRGAYLPGPINSDPWGNRYMVNVEFLARTQNTTPSGSVKDVYVLSAGSNQLVETAFEVDGVTSDSDIISAFSGGTQ